MNLQPTDIALLIGASVLTISFVFKWYQTTTKKHTIEMSLKSWIIMLFGRMLWCIYGFMLGTIGGIFILVAQGLIACMTVPIIYYISRNKGTEGEYFKKHFNKKLFLMRMLIDFIILTIICLFVVFTSYHPHWNYSVPNWLIFVIGTIGAATTAYALLPQTIKIIKSKNTKSMSLPLQTTFILGNAIIIIYLLYQLITTGNYMSYLGSIIFGITSTLLMVPILVIKVKNIHKFKESIH